MSETARPKTFHSCFSVF